MIDRLNGFEHIASGKVRELYKSKLNQDHLLVVATDRISAFDNILTPEIPQKGEVLTAVSNIWFNKLEHIVQNHLVKNESELNSELANIPENILRRSMLCQKLDMIEVECVVRGYLTGSAYTEYQKTGKYLDINLPEGLEDGSKLAEPIFTPAMKAQVGEHDENVTFKEVVNKIGQNKANQIRDISLKIFNYASKEVEKLGYVLVDTKFEFGINADGEIVLADEVLTPDSSRYLDKDGNSVDKQFVRDYLLKESGWDSKSNQKPPNLPDYVVKETSELYKRILSNFQQLN